MLRLKDLTSTPVYPVDCLTASSQVIRVTFASSPLVSFQFFLDLPAFCNSDVTELIKIRIRRMRVLM